MAQVSGDPVHSLKPPTSHGARARHLRLSQAAVASGAHLPVGVQLAARLQRLGAAARRPPAPKEADKRQHGVAQPGSRGCGSQAPGRGRGRAYFCDFHRMSVQAARLCEKVDDLSAVVSLVVVMLVSTAHDSTLVDARGWCRAQKTARTSDSRNSTPDVNTCMCVALINQRSGTR